MLIIDKYYDIFIADQILAFEMVANKKVPKYSEPFC